jgi:hypothetical protein
MMSGSDHPSRAGRLAALATLAVSASLFLTALFGISSIDPGADVSTPARGLSPTQSISLDPAATDRGHDGDCPWRDRGGASGEQPRQRSTS